MVRRTGAWAGSRPAGFLVGTRSWAPYSGMGNCAGSVGAEVAGGVRAGDFLGFDLLCSSHEAVEQGLGAGRATGDVDVDRG